MPRRPAPRPTELQEANKSPQSPIPSSEDKFSQNLASLRTHWKWAAFSQFFYTFSRLFAMQDVSLNDIEQDLVRGSNIFLPRVMTRLLFILSYDRKVSLDNWQAVLRKQYKRRDPASNPIGPEPESEPRYRYKSVSVDAPTPAPADDGSVEASVGPDDGGRDLETSRGNALGNEDNQVEDYQQPERKDWLDLPMLTKLDSMHLLTEWQFQNPTRFRTLMKSDDEDASWRIEPIGYDAKSNAYWLIGADRLWIQRVHPKPTRYTATTSSLKRKRLDNATVSKTKGKRPAAKRPRLAGEDPARLTITVPGGGRAAKTRAKLKLDAQAKELAELNRLADAKTAVPRRAHGMRNSIAPSRPMGTRVSARLRGAEDDEWQEIPPDWLDENETTGKLKLKTGLESDDESISDLTELSEQASDDKEEETEELGPLPGNPAANGGDGLLEGFVEWETVCVTLFDWEHIAERFEKGTHYTEKALYKVLTKDIVPVITEELREIERKRRLEDAVVHRKRSSRIANKESEKEEARMLARQKAEVEEKRTRAQRLEARSAKEEAERKRREAAREQRRQNTEAQETRSAVSDENESTVMHVDVVGDDDPPPEKNGTAIQLSQSNDLASAGNSTTGTRTPQGEDWILNCEICLRSGVNADDGIPMLCCGSCSQWQHIACHDRADVQAGRPRRNWNHVEFVCHQCQQRASKNSGQGQDLLHLSQAPSASYKTYGLMPPPLSGNSSQREFPSSYPISLNGATAYAPDRAGPSDRQQDTSLSMLPSGVLPYNDIGPAQQFSQATYERVSSQFQQMAPNRAHASQRPVGNPPSWNYVPDSYSPLHTSNDGAQWRAGRTQQATAFRFQSGR